MRKPSLTARLAEQIDRQTFANLVLASEVAAPHAHVLCSHDSRCFLLEALAASADRIATDGKTLAAEYQHRGGAS